MLVRPSKTLLLTLALGCVLMDSAFGLYSKKTTTYESVVKEAQNLSRKPYKPVKSRLPKPFLNLDYDGYRKIVWNPEQTLWKQDDLNFRMELFHPGYLFKEPVRINEFSDSHVQTVPFSSELYHYGDLALNPRKISRRAEYAGFKLLFPLNDGNTFDEFLSFLGASYFRALGTGQRYGKSARALAINTGMDKPEEFPVFREFWIGKPEFESVQVQIFALLDSPSVSGAFQFKVQPGKETVIDVTCTLFFRKAVDWLGLAPLTSMYWYGENSIARPNDFRPEVHDSDGLLVQTDTGSVWRPLVNDGRKRTHVESSETIQGFGLMQRDQSFDHYQDLEAWYQARPSVWVEPTEAWKPGSVQLIEFPSNNEYFDNIVSAWVPEETPTVGEAFHFSYRLRWTQMAAPDETLARVYSTRQGAGLDGKPGSQFVLEFTQPKREKKWDVENLSADFSGSGEVAIADVKLLENPFDNRWRVVFRAYGHQPADVVCRLIDEGEVVSETWSYPWKPN